MKYHAINQTIINYNNYKKNDEFCEHKTFIQNKVNLTCMQKVITQKYKRQTHILNNMNLNKLFAVGGKVSSLNFLFFSRSKDLLMAPFKRESGANEVST